MCLDSCQPGMTRPGADGKEDPEPWSCRPLGNRTRFEPWCSWPGEDCSTLLSPTCCMKGSKCVVKDLYWSSCASDGTGVPEGWNGTVLGGSRSEYSVAPVPPDAPDAKTAGTSLFCFMALLPGSGEQALLQAAQNRTASIFACEAHATYDSTWSKYQDWGNGQKTLANTAVFLQVWNHVQQDGLYLAYDWTVKVDADAVFFPDRLRSHIVGLRPPAYPRVYLKNTKSGDGMLGGFLGALEILSKTAVQIVIDNLHSCEQHIGTASGEDGFLKDCMDALGIGFLQDPILLLPDPKVGSCGRGEVVAFHPFKAQGDWIGCYNAALR